MYFRRKGGHAILGFQCVIEGIRRLCPRNPLGFSRLGGSGRFGWEERRTAKAAQPVQTAKEGLGVLSGGRLAVALARITQYQAHDPTPAPLSLALIDRHSQVEVSCSPRPIDTPGARSVRGWPLAACAQIALSTGKNP